MAKSASVLRKRTAQFGRSFAGQLAVPGARECCVSQGEPVMLREQKGRWLPGAPSRARDCRLSGVVTPRRQNVTGGGSRAAAGRANRRSTDVAQWRGVCISPEPEGQLERISSRALGRNVLFKLSRVRIVRRLLKAIHLHRYCWQAIFVVKINMSNHCTTTSKYWFVWCASSFCSVYCA